MKHLLRTLLVLAPVALSAQTIVGSKHDLANATTGLYTGTTQVCVFCHTPHAAAASASGPLWNHAPTTVASYTVYASSSLIGTVGQPGAQSKSCLSCHDGTVAVGSLVNTPAGLAINTTNAAGKLNTTTGLMLSTNPNYVGTDLSNDHPVAVAYPVATGYKAAATHTTVKLYSNLVECASCHDVHNPTNAPFLRRSNNASALCTECHTK